MKEKIQEQIRALTSEWDGIKAKAKEEERVMTDEEFTRAEEIGSELTKLRSQLETVEALEAQEKHFAEPVNPPVKPEPDGDKREKTEVGDDRKAKQPFETFGEQMQSVAMASISQGREIDPRLLELRATGASESVPSEGGFLVQQDFSDELLKMAFDTGVLAPRTRRIPISGPSNSLKFNAIDETSRADGSRWGGIQAFWTDEAADATAKKPKFRQVTMSLQKLTGLAYATEELLEDSSALGSILQQGFSEEFAFKIDDAIINGDGAGKPLGVLNSGYLVSVAKETGQAANTIESDNVIKMWARMFGRLRANAVWLINQDIEPQLHTLSIAVGTAGVPLYQPANGLSDSPFSTLYGKPVIPIEHCATLGTKGDIIFANFSDYIMIEKGGIKADRSIHVKFVAGETAFRFVLRVDGQPAHDVPITPFKGTNTLSAFVSLDTRA